MYAMEKKIVMMAQMKSAQVRLIFISFFTSKES